VVEKKRKPQAKFQQNSDVPASNKVGPTNTTHRSGQRSPTTATRTETDDRIAEAVDGQQAREQRRRRLREITQRRQYTRSGKESIFLCRKMK